MFVLAWRLVLLSMGSPLHKDICLSLLACCKSLRDLIRELVREIYTEGSKIQVFPGIITLFPNLKVIRCLFNEFPERGLSTRKFMNVYNSILGKSYVLSGSWEALLRCIDRLDEFTFLLKDVIKIDWLKDVNSRILSRLEPSANIEKLEPSANIEKLRIFIIYDHLEKSEVKSKENICLFSLDSGVLSISSNRRILYRMVSNGVNIDFVNEGSSRCWRNINMVIGKVYYPSDKKKEYPSLEILVDQPQTILPYITQMRDFLAEKLIELDCKKNPERDVRERLNPEKNPYIEDMDEEPARTILPRLKYVTYSGRHTMHDSKIFFKNITLKMEDCPIWHIRSSQTAFPGDIMFIVSPRYPGKLTMSLVDITLMPSFKESWELDEDAMGKLRKVHEEIAKTLSPSNKLVTVRHYLNFGKKRPIIAIDSKPGSKIKLRLEIIID